ncbi:MAG: sensor histidine kinase, partial [Bacteroidota bacterium]
HNGVARIDFIEYTQRLCRHLANLSPDGSYPQFNLQIEPIFFNLETSIPLGIMLTELLTNSLKYARLPERELRIGIQLQAFEDQFKIVYRDNGPGLPEGGIRQREGGLGTYLLRSMARQLRGELVSRTESGAVFEIQFFEKNKLTNIEINPEEIRLGASTEQ